MPDPATARLAQVHVANATGAWNRYMTHEGNLAAAKREQRLARDEFVRSNSDALSFLLSDIDALWALLGESLSRFRLALTSIALGNGQEDGEAEHIIAAAIALLIEHDVVDPREPNEGPNHDR